MKKKHSFAMKRHGALAWALAFMWTDFRNIVLGRSLSLSPHNIRVSFRK